MRRRELAIFAHGGFRHFAPVAAMSAVVLLLLHVTDFGDERVLTVEDPGLAAAPLGEDGARPEASAPSAVSVAPVATPQPSPSDPAPSEQSLGLPSEPSWPTGPVGDWVGEAFDVGYIRTVDLRAGTIQFDRVQVMQDSEWRFGLRLDREVVMPHHERSDIQNASSQLYTFGLAADLELLRHEPSCESAAAPVAFASGRLSPEMAKPESNAVLHALTFGPEGRVRQIRLNESCS